MGGSMQLIKSIIYIALISILFYSSATFAAQDGDYTYTESGGNATITDYTGSGGAISIPSTLGGFPTVAIGDTAFGYSDNDNETALTSVIIPGSVKTIGANAFRRCINITSIIIPDGVMTIGEKAFAHMYALASVSIPASVTSIGTYGFYGGRSNTGITVHPDNPNYSSLDGVLYNKDKTTLIQYPCGKAGPFTIPTSVTSIGIAAFELCSGLTSITFAGNIESISQAAFANCPGLTGISLPSSLLSVGAGAFAGCSNLAGARFYGSTPTGGSGCFDYCAAGFTIYYTAGKGWGSTWNTYPTSACTDADNDTYAVEGGFCGATDCRDNNSSVHPGAVEVCNGIDDNCNGHTDENYVSDTSCFLPGACAAANTASSCSGGIETPCTTGTPSPEICNGIDDDCNGTIDNGITRKTYYRDADTDTYGNADSAMAACSAPAGYVDNSSGFDCNDNASAVNPGADEICNGIDDDCDGSIDNGLDNCPADNCTDADGDGYFAGKGCTPFDCDDTDWKIHEGCEAAPCTLNIVPKQISRLGSFIVPVVPFIISAESESDINFGTYSVSFSSDAIRCLIRVRIGTRIIIGFYAVNPFKLEQGDTTAEVEMYGQSPDTRCAAFVVK
jgi:hypothetical protein